MLACRVYSVRHPGAQVHFTVREHAMSHSCCTLHDHSDMSHVLRDLATCPTRIDGVAVRFDHGVMIMELWMRACQAPRGAMIIMT